MDLSAEGPSPDAKVVQLASRRQQPEGHMDLSETEYPSESANLDVSRTVWPEASSLAFEFHIWKAVGVSFKYNVHGPAAWAAPLCTVVLANAILAASVVPRLILASTASDSLRMSVAATSGGFALVAGTLILLHLLRKKS